MSSKRQQVRNERTLQELVKTVPGNNTCADCFARNPGWASWSLGIFLCMRCAGLHRKLGTHISKVKSLSMDSWSSEQVEFMKRTGNIASNRIYNPTNLKPNVPLDIDEVDPAMEKYIRQKYTDKDLQGTRIQPTRIQPQRRHDTGSTESDERHSPPPLPPKTHSSRFGFKSGTSMFPMSSKSKRKAEARAQELGPQSPPMVHNKQSKVFGAAVGESMSAAEDLESKLDTLREMGFNDDKRNMTVLKGLNGNLQRSIETLVRLGEGTRPNLPPRPITRTTSKESSGISFDKSLPQEVNPHQQSNNPFDMPVPQPQSSQSTGTLAQPPYMNGSNPYQNAIGSNPFGPVASQSQYDINQSFQNLSFSDNATQSQTLFPHRTGGFPSQHHQHQKFLPSLETSVQAVPQQYPASATTPYSNVYDFQPPQQNPGLNQQQQTYNNPFLQQAPSGNGNIPSNPFLNHASTFPLAAQQPTNSFAQQQQQSMQQPQQQQQVQQSFDWSGQQPQQQWGNPQSQAQNQTQYQQEPQIQQQYAQQPQYQYQPQQLMSQQTGRANKSDIMALYNSPQLAAPATQNLSETQLPANGQSYQPNAQSYQTNAQSYQPNGHPYQPNGQPYQSNGQQATASPLASTGSNNPFMNTVGHGNGDGNGGGTGQMNGGGGSKQSRESIMVEGGGWMNGNGRHSPDAFASLSTVQTRSMR